jgi:hypothetical protein
MSDWLAPLHHALDGRTGDVRVFFRDDDAGWADERLFQFLDLFDACEYPVDLAVIPAAVTDSLASALLARRQAGARIGFHQHGFSHENHEPDGRPCEFGLSRPVPLQALDIAEGQRRLTALFGRDLDPIFTPPWNRCCARTGHALVTIGMRAISRDVTATPLGVQGLAECPVHVDWFAKSKGQRLDQEQWAWRLARRIADGTDPVGIMFHHARMDAAEFAACEQLLRAMSAHPMVRRVAMKEMVVTS